MRRRVINVVGHELRTPLTTIRGLADLLVDAPEDELRTTLIPALVRNARRAERLLDDLLIAGDVATARPTTPPTPLDVGALVRRVAEEHEITVSGAPDGEVLAHAEQLTHALLRLVENAEAYAEGHPVVSFEGDDESVVVVVRTPVEKAIPDIELGFELFFRGESAVTRSAGLGVGLPVARALARLDGGDVTIEQVDGEVVTRLRIPRVES